MKLKFARFVRAFGKPDWGDVAASIFILALVVAVSMFLGGMAGVIITGAQSMSLAWALWGILFIPAGAALIAFICFLFWKLYEWAKNYADEVDKEDRRWESGDYDEN